LAASKIKSHAPRRVSFAKIREPLEVPNLLSLQLESIDWLLGNEAWRARLNDAEKSNRGEVPKQSGLEEIFEEISPIEDFQGSMSLSFRDPDSNHLSTQLPNAKSAISPTQLHFS